MLSSSTDLESKLIGQEWISKANAGTGLVPVGCGKKFRDGTLKRVGGQEGTNEQIPLQVHAWPAFALTEETLGRRYLLCYAAGGWISRAMNGKSEDEWRRLCPAWTWSYRTLCLKRPVGRERALFNAPSTSSVDIMFATWYHARSNKVVKR